MQIISQCSICRHFHARNRVNETCVAFPDGISKGILNNKVDHRQQVEDDGGVRWELAQGLPATEKHPLDG